MLFTSTYLFLLTMGYKLVLSCATCLLSRVGYIKSDFLQQKRNNYQLYIPKVTSTGIIYRQPTKDETESFDAGYKDI